MEISNKNKVFFGEVGVTSTSATYLCNIARELLKDLEASLNNVSFITEEVSILGSENTVKTREGYNSSELSDLNSKLMKAAELKAFIAWMSEGIKAKDQENTRVSQYTLEDYISDFPEEAVSKVKEFKEDFEYGIGKLSISDRVKFLYSEALVSSIGAYIHKKGALKEAYEELLDIAHNKVNVETDTRDSLVLLTNKIPSVDVKDVEKILLKYQNLRREHEKELNSIKSKLKSLDHEYRVHFNLEHKSELERYKQEMGILQSKYHAYVLNRMKEIENLKIIIPKELEKIYNYLEIISKEK